MERSWKQNPMEKTLNPKWRRPHLSGNQLFTALWMQAGCPQKLIVKIKGKPVTLINGLPEGEASSQGQKENSRPGPSQRK